MKKLSILFTLMACCLMACTGGQKKTTNMETGNETLVRLETTMGNITVKLYNETPKHRDGTILSNWRKKVLMTVRSSTA